MTLRECSDESFARGVVVVGAPGNGKSRLRREFVARVEAQSRAKVLLARADPVQSQSPLSLVRQLLRRAFGLLDAPGDERAAVRSRLELLRGAPAPDRLVDFLGHLAGVPQAPDPSPEMRVALGDPRSLGAGLARAFLDWLDSECHARPLLLVLEDVHWGDRASLDYLVTALKSRVELPFMVLALTRSAEMEALRGARSGAVIQEVSLGRLSRRAAERLIRDVVGVDLDQDTVVRVVDLADGNPFHLEELIRHAIENGGSGLPQTLVALLEARLERLEPRQWQLVRSASVFGDVFWRGGVEALVGAGDESTALDAELRELTERELFARNRETRFEDQDEYAFRHSLLREVAYGTLTPGEKASAHALAGAWLARHGERDPLTVAEHFERGNDPARAIPWFVRAAQDAADVDMRTARRIGEHALALGAEGEHKGALLWTLAQASAMSGDWPAAWKASAGAMELLPERSEAWIGAAAAMSLAAGMVGDITRTLPALQVITSMPRPLPESGAFYMALFWTVQAAASIGQVEAARALLGAVTAEARGAADAASACWLRAADGYLALSDGDLGTACVILSEATALGKASGAALATAAASMCFVFALCQTGHIARTEEVARDALVLCERLGLEAVAAWIQYHLAWAYVVGGQAGNALPVLDRLLDERDQHLVVTARGLLVCAHFYLGDLEGALRVAPQVEVPVSAPNRTGQLARNALLALAQGNLETALTLSASAIETIPLALPLVRTWTMLIRAEVLHAAGHMDAARAQIGAASDALLSTAATLPDAELRASFLHEIRFNARTLELASEWLGGDDASTGVT